MSATDQLQRFIFEHSDIRGEIVTLEESYQQIVKGRSYPTVIKHLLGEMLAATALLSTTLKFDGTITLQARGNGPLSMIMVDCTRHHNLRGLAQIKDGAKIPSEANLKELIGNGHLALTIDLVKSGSGKGERYQGIVPLECDSLAHCLEDYFERSEQLPTKLWLSSNGNRCGGLLLQALPRQLEANPEKNQKIWQHVIQLAETLTPQEQLELDQETQLFRLFHQDQVRLLETRELQFNCGCSRKRTEQALAAIGEKELLEIIAETGVVTMDCHFCQYSYRFSEQEIKNIFFSQPPVLH